MKDGKFEIGDEVYIENRPYEKGRIITMYGDPLKYRVMFNPRYSAWLYSNQLTLKDSSPPPSSDLKDTNPKDAAATTRLDLTLFPDTAVAYGALAFTEGCKYGAYNYREKGASISTYVTSNRRHLAKFYNGEWADKKTGVPHLASALAGIAIIIDGFVQGNIVDDRPPSVDMDKLLTEFEDKVKHLHGVFDMEPRCTELGQHEKAIAAVSSFDDGPFNGMFDGDDGGDL